MSLDVYLRLCAAASGRAQPRAARRHVHLSARPLVVVGYHLAGQPNAPVAVRYGDAPDRSRLLVVPDPRRPGPRLRVLAEFARDLLAWLDGFTAREAPADAGGGDPSADGGGGDPADAVCVDAPQILCPNAATAAWVTDLLGRYLRHLPTEGDNPVDEVLPHAGLHLSFFSTRRVLPGSSLVLAATEALTTHWVTGQVPVEDAHLGTVLAWVDPPPGSDGPQAAVEAERQPAAGPVSDPDWDRRVLQPRIGALTKARGDAATAAAEAELAEACQEVLAPAWRDTWRAYRLLATLPEGDHVAARWADDRRAWTFHLDRMAAGRAYFPTRLDELRSFAFLHELEERTVALARQMALDDPLVMAARVAAGQALAGELVDRDCAHTVRGPKRMVVRPLLRVRPVVPFTRPVGTRVWWAANLGVRAVLRSHEPDGTVVLMVDKGACRSAAQAAQVLPEPGTRVAFLDVGEEHFPQRLPEELPWTHVPATEPA